MSYLFITLLISQNLFARAYGGTSSDRAWSITQTSDGGYAVAGLTTSFGAGSNDFLVLKLNPDGSLDWARTFGGTDYDDAYSIVQTSDGGYAVAGWTGSFGAGGNDLLVIKLNPDGSLAWTRTFGGADDDEAESVTQTSDGGYAVAGYTDSFGAGSEDFMVLKLNPDGSLDWARTFGWTGSEEALSITQTPDGGYAVAGYTTSFGAGGRDFMVLKLNPDGSLDWARTFGGADYDYVQSITQTSDGGYVVAGGTLSFGAGSYDFLVLKLNPDGSLDWARTFGGTDYDQAEAITQTSDGGCAVAGYTSSFGAGYAAFLVLKLNPDGSLDWARTFGGTDYDDAYSIVQTSDGGYAVAGYTSSFGAGYAAFLVLKLDQDGNYPGCVETCSPTVGTPSSSTIPTGLSTAARSPSTSSPSPTVGAPTLTVRVVCPPAVEELGPGHQARISCSPFAGGALFISPEAMGIKIYAADGRLAYSGELKKGENKISLGTGVYLWRAGAYRGKVAIR